MILRMSTVNRCLLKYGPVCCMEGSPDAVVRTVVAYEPDAGLDDSTLYVGAVSQLPYPLPRNFVGVGDVPPPQNRVLPAGTNLTLLPGSARFADVFLTLCNCLLAEDNTRLASFASEVLYRLSDANDLRSVTEVAYSYLNNPIIISDKNWRTMIQYPEIDIPEDKDWMQFKDNGMLSIEVVTENMKANLAETLSKSTVSFRWKDERMAYHRLYCNVSISRHSAATISVLEYSRPFTPQDYEILPIFANAVSAEMQKRENLGYPRGLSYEKFLADILDGKVNSAAVANDRLHSLNITLRQYLCLFVVDMGSFDSGNFSISFFRDYLERIVSGSKALVYKNYIVIFKSFNRPKNVGEVIETAGLRGFLMEHNASCGVSCCVDHITELGAAFHQAVEAISVGTYMQAKPPFYFYSELVIYHIAKICNEYDNIRYLCSPKLLKLLEYDRKHNTAFTKSLYAYFESSRNITRASAALNLHRNSTIYHLKKIGEIIDVDFTDADTMLYLELSCRFLEYNNKFLEPGM